MIVNDTMAHGVTWSLPQDDVITLTSGATYTVPDVSMSTHGPYTVASSWGDIGTIGHASGRLCLTGEDADIEINGMSLTETLKGLQDRLNILRPNAELESRWDELRQARERYQQLEQEIIEKERAWQALQQQG